jgi:hypothetical protein
MQVKYFEVVDKMVRQLVARLSAAEEAGTLPFTLVVTGDHSTPAIFGDHSHEPVPFAIAHVKYVLTHPCHRITMLSAPSRLLASASKHSLGKGSCVTGTLQMLWEEGRTSTGFPWERSPTLTLHPCNLACPVLHSRSVFGQLSALTLWISIPW